MPAGYNWDGVRLVRNKKGSKRPPDVPSEFWHMYSAQQRKEEIERWEKKVARAEAAKKEELENEAPAMPVLLGYKEPHRPKYESNMERMHDLYLDKLEQTADELYALVAKVINQNDVAKIPEAQEAMDKEWQKLLYKVCWVESQVREFEDVQKEVRQKGQKAHFGRIFEDMQPQARVPSFQRVIPSASTRGALCFRETRFETRMRIMRSSPN